MLQLRILVFVGLLLSSVTVARAEEPQGTIKGMLMTRDHQAKYAGRAVVFLCDAKTGRPLLAKDKTTQYDRDSFDDGLQGLLHAVTEMNSGFTFEDVPTGRYRLVAQSWSGVEGIPTRKTTSTIVLVHGAANNVEVEAGEVAIARIRPLGDGVMRVENDPEEAGAYLFVGTKPMWGDPILSYTGWGDEYVRNIVAITHMSVPNATFIGLPNDRDVHLGLFAYDNSPGVGGGTHRVGKDRVATIRIFSAWSNGHDEPPQKLLPIVQYLEQHKPTLPQLMQLGPDEGFLNDRGRLDRRKLREAILKNGDKQVEVQGVGTFRVIDISAAEGYRRLREHHRKRRERVKGRQQPAFDKVGSQPDDVKTKG